MKRGVIIFASLVLACALTVAAHSESKAPFEIVRSMHALQDQMVLGSTAAQAALPKLSNKIADTLLAAPPDTWRDPKNARAAVTYVLGGGQPRVARRVLEIGNAPPEERKLMEGALAYLEGRTAKAKQILGDVDARTLIPLLGGHVALVQAALLASDDPKKAVQLLDIARLVAPGTLVEEAGLRREIMLVDQTGDMSKFVFLTSQYLRRFQHSVYFDNFRQRFSLSVVRLGILSNPTQFSELDRLMNDVQPDERLRLYLMISQAAVINGKITVAHTAAEKAASLAQNGSVEGVRSSLYEGAALILTNNYENGLAKLQAIDSSQLPKKDAELKEAVLSLAKEMRKVPDLTRPGAEPSLGALAESKNVPTTSSAAAMIDQAQKALSDTDDLLRGDPP